MHRKGLALVLVLVLTGTGMAAQQNLYHDTGLVAEGHLSIQQHTVYTEFIVESTGPDNEENVTEFAAVVGLVKKCKRTEDTFDNAVLWFNDNFLFGTKRNIARNHTPEDVMGVNPVRIHNESTLNDTNRRNGTGQYDPSSGQVNASNGTGPDEGGNPDRDGFMRAQDNRERWGGCYIPNGYLHVVANGQADSAEAALEGEGNDCNGTSCNFEYEGTHYVTDPNNHRWMIDRFEWSGGHMFTVHLQVDPWNPDRQGFPDEAIWSYREDGRVRLGQPYDEDPDGPCHDDAKVNGQERYADDGGWDNGSSYDEMQREGGNGSGMAEHRRGPVGTMTECSIEYNFLATVDFASISTTGGGPAHGPGGGNDGDTSQDGNSHPHNPEACYRENPTGDGPCSSGPRHNHNVATVDLFFHERAPYFTEQNPYWDQPVGMRTVGEPPIVTEDCKDTMDPNDPRRPGVTERKPLVCDVGAFSGFHLHDGSQTNPPG